MEKRVLSSYHQHVAEPNALRRTATAVDRALRHMAEAGVEFDALVSTGTSGLPLLGALAYMGWDTAYVRRKDG